MAQRVHDGEALRRNDGGIPSRAGEPKVGFGTAAHGPARGRVG